MKLSLERTLPAVGHKMPLKALMGGLMPGRVNAQLKVPGEAEEVFFTSSGSAALAVALLAAKRTSSRKKVIIPAYTCPSVLAAVEKAKLVAILCDLSRGQLTMDIGQLSHLVDNDTLAVVHVHLFGLDRRAADIRSIAMKSGALFIEDAAQAFGNRVGGRYLGSESDLAILSFGRGKPLSALHGGAVVVNNSQMAAPVREAMLMHKTETPIWFGTYYRVLLTAYTFLFHPKLFRLPQMLPWFRIGETIYIADLPIRDMIRPAKSVLSTLMGRRLPIQRGRAVLADTYRTKLEPLRRFFSYLPAPEEILTGPLRYPFIFKNAAHQSRCLRLMEGKRLGASRSYPWALNAQPGVPRYIAEQGPFPGAEAVASGIMTLPTHELVGKRDVDDMVKIIEQVVSEA